MEYNKILTELWISNLEDIARFVQRKVGFYLLLISLGKILISYDPDVKENVLIKSVSWRTFNLTEDLLDFFIPYTVKAL